MGFLSPNSNRDFVSPFKIYSSKKSAKYSKDKNFLNFFLGKINILFINRSKKLNKFLDTSLS